MQCPVDGETLLLSERQGVEIDYCPKCRGVWLDRGELDKLLQRDDDDWREYERDRGDRGYDRDRDRDREYDRDREHDRERQYGSQRYPRKKKRFLSEIFDFD